MWHTTTSSSELRSISNVPISATLYLPRVFGAIVATALLLGRTTSLAPDASKAKLSAGRILALMNRTSSINASSPEGRKLVSY